MGCPARSGIMVADPRELACRSLIYRYRSRRLRGGSRGEGWRRDRTVKIKFGRPGARASGGVDP